MDKKNIKSKIDLNYEITTNGSLGLLALGDVGLVAWRKVKKESEEKGTNE